MKRRGTVRVGLVVLGLVTAVGAVWMLRSGGIGTEEQTPVVSAERKVATHPASVASAKTPSQSAAVEKTAGGHSSQLPDRKESMDSKGVERVTDTTTPPAPLAPANLATPTRAGPQPLSDETIADIGKVQDRYAKCEVLDERTGPVDAAGQYERVRVVRTNEKYPFVRVEERFQVSGVRDQEPGDRFQESGVRGQETSLTPDTRLVRRSPARSRGGEGGPLTPSSSPLKPDTRPLTPSSDKLLSQTAMVADHVTLQVKDGTTEAQLAAYAQAQGGTILRKLRVPGAGTYLVKMAEAKVDTVPQAMAALSQPDAPAKYVNPDFIAYALETIPNDEHFGLLWGMKNTGQTLAAAPREPKTGIAGCDIKATEAWDITTGSKDVLVAVIDTGIDYTHEDLAANMWTNPGETGTDADGKDKRANGIDDDGNGFVDDWHGWDFCNDDNDSKDDHYHGTHCAGTIGAVGNNGIGVAGVCWNVSLVGLKFLSAGGSGAFSDGVEAIYYATKIGVKLTSNSWGGLGDPDSRSDDSDLMRQAILDAGAHGILFVTAAGNNATDNDGTTVAYPASFDCDNIIAVAATDSRDQMASFSCYGATTVDLGAPGVNIGSTITGNDYGYLAGTSMACPDVAGACALLASVLPGWNATQIKEHLLANVDPIPALAGKCVTGGRLNIGAAVPSPTPSLRFRDVSVNDAAGGNGDGLLNPGESAQLTVSLRNYSLQPLAVGVSATLSCTDAMVTVVDNAADFGTFASFETKQALDSFSISISPSCPTPRTVTLNLSSVAAGVGAWTNTFQMTIYTSYPIAGTVTLDGAPVAGVTIACAGPLNGARVTDAAGKYIMGALAGTNIVTAKKDGWADSVPVNMTTPPGASNVNFTFTTATVSGRVTDALTGAGLAGVTIVYSNAVTGSVTTDSNGSYAFTRVYGRTATLTVTAQKTGYFDFVKTVTVPPNAIVDFAMGYSDIDVTPTSFDVTAVMGQVVTRSLTISNLGASALTYAINPGGRVLRKVNAPEANPGWSIEGGGVAFDGSAGWEVNDTGWGTMYKFDPLTGALLQRLNVNTPWISTKSGAGLNWDGVNLWTAQNIRPATGSADGYGTSVIAVNPVSGDIVKTLAFRPGLTAYQQIMGVSVGGGYVWVKAKIGDYPNTTTWICKLDPVTGAELAAWRIPDAILSYYYSGFEYMNGAIWVPGFEKTSTGAYEEYYSIYKLNATTGQVIERFQCALGLSNGGVTSQMIYDLEKAGSRTMFVTGGGQVWLVEIGDEPWMREDPRSGTVPGLSSQTVTLTLDTVAAGVGVHESVYRIASNDPDEPEVTIPIKFTVQPNPSNHAPVIAEGASVNVTMSEDASPTPFSLTLHATDADNDTLVWRLVNAAAHGAVVANGVGTSLPVIYNPFARYSGADSFTVEVADGKGGVATIAVNVTIQHVNHAPTVTSAANVMIGAAPLPVAFTSAGADVDGDALSYSWSFGDGQTSTEQNPRHTYVTAGTYAVTVTVADLAGLSAQAPLVITVWASAPTGGVAYAWGKNDYGQLGDGSKVDSCNPKPVPGLSGISAIGGSYRGFVALKPDGTVFTWGDNRYGQLGDGTTTDRLTPQQATAFAGAVAIGIQNLTCTFAVKPDGTVWGCGGNLYGNLGDGTTMNRLLPVQVKMADGTPLTNVLSVAAGGYHTAAVKRDGTVWAWGYNWIGALGDGTISTAPPYCKTNPVQAKLADGTPLTGVIAVAVGDYHTMALKSDGTVWVWGYNGDCQLGTGGGGSPNPVQVSGLANIVAIAAGYAHSLAVQNDGRVWGWGYNMQGQVGDGTAGRIDVVNHKKKPRPVQALISNVTAIAAGNEHTVAIKSDGTAWAWGLNLSGQLGNGTFMTFCPLPAPVMRFDGTPFAAVTAISASWNNSVAIVGSESAPKVIADASAVTVPEGGSATFGVKLAQAPTDSVTVTVAKMAGDNSITVQSGASLTFTPANWNTYQTVTLAAAHDSLDTANGTATIACSAPGWLGCTLPAVEADNDVLVCIYAAPGGTVSPFDWNICDKGEPAPIVATPYTGYTFVNWTVLTGPATFADANAATTTVTVANDAPTAYPYTQIRANFAAVGNRPPVITTPALAGPNPVTLPNGATVHVTASDPDDDPLDYAWTKVSGVGVATLGAPNAPNCGVTFSSPGTYVLRATITDGRGGSVTSDVTIAVNGAVAPAAPTGFAATTVATNQINLAWIDNASNENGYVVDRSTDSNAWVQVVLTSVNVTNTSSTGLTTNTLYYYRVAASNAGGLSAYCFASARTWSVYEAWLRSHFGGADLNNLSISGPTADPDHDGLNNEQEYWAGTIPTNAASCLVLYALTNNPAVPGEYVVRWQSATGRIYTVQAATNLVAGFTNLVTHRPATPPVNVHTDNVGSVEQRFYRVKVE